MRKVYLIGLNDSFILDLAIALKEKGYEEVTGSDKTLSAENRERLDKAGVNYSFPWNPGNLDQEIDYVVHAAHITLENTEMQRAQELNLQIMSIPEFIYDRTKGKTRLVVTGTKGKKSMMAILLNVLKRQKIDFDYTLSKPVTGIDSLVSLKYDARIAVIEGDELISSPIRKKHKLEFYRPHIAIITNIIWKETKDSPTREKYTKIFQDFAQTIERDGKFIYNETDDTLKEFAAGIRKDITAIPYTVHPVSKEGEGISLDTRFGKYPIAAKNNYFLENLNGARNACRQLGISDKDFYAAVSEISTQLQ